MANDVRPNPVGPLPSEEPHLREQVRALEEQCRRLQRSLDDVRAERDQFKLKYLAYRGFGDEDVEAFIENVKRYPAGWVSSEEFLSAVQSFEQEESCLRNVPTR